MNTFFLKQTSYLLSTTAAFLAGFSSVDAQAETVNSHNSKVDEAIATKRVQSSPSETALRSQPLLAMAETNLAEPADRATITLAAVSQEFSTATISESPLPGSALTSAAALETASSEPSTSFLAQADQTAPTTPDTTSPTDATPGTTTPDTTTPDTTSPTDTTPGTTSPDTTVVPGRATRSGSSYVGIGGNFGIGDGDTALGETSFSIFSKIGLTRSLSVRPSILIGDNVTILLPITYDFSIGEGPTEGVGFRAAPFVGAGAAISTGDDSGVDLLLTGGIDIPLSSQFTATAAVNASVTGNPAVGLFIGIGYNFAGF